MNEYNDPEFDQAVSGFHSAAYQPPTGAPASPYGPNPNIPAGSIPTKPGLTRRGRTALTLGAVVLAGGGLIGWQHHADTVATNELKAKELQIQQTKLALEQQKALDKANKDATKAQTAAAKTRQAKVDACVNANKDLIEHRLGTTLGSVIDDCQKQYPDLTQTGSDMQEAASTQTTGGGSSEGLLIAAGAVLVGGLWVGVRKATRPQPAPQTYGPYYPHG
jgi:phage terminase Nu1 subunit (DNA packaging protein)